VLLLHEMPSFSYRTVQLADRLADEGYQVVMPLLFGGVRRRQDNKLISAVTGGLDFASSLVKVCVSWQFVALVQRRTSPIASWLIALAREEAAASGHSRVGVIGMCFSGGFALAAAVDPVVSVAVASQPATPFAWIPLNLIPGQTRDVGLSDEDWARLLARRKADDVCVRTFRFSRDWKSPRQRVARIKDALASDERYDCIPSTNRNAHAVLTDATDVAMDPDTAPVLDEVLASLIATLRDALGPAS
jgi:dienelactone hydrolase